MTAPDVGITKPVAMPPPIAAALHAGAWAVFNLSGGKDSSAALFATTNLLDAIGHPRERRLAIGGAVVITAQGIAFHSTTDVIESAIQVSRTQPATT